MLELKRIKGSYGSYYHQTNTGSGRLLNGKIGPFLEKNIFLREERLLEWGEFVLAERCATEDVVALLELGALWTDINHDASNIASENSGPFFDEKASLLLHGVTSRHQLLIFVSLG